MKKMFLATAIAVLMANVSFAGEWIQNGDAWMYQDDDGSFVTGEQKRIDGKFYYFDESGCLLTGYQVIGADFYVFNNDGTPKTEPIVYDGVTYNVNARGKISNMNAALFEKIQDNSFITNTGALSGDLAYASTLVTKYPISKKALREIMQAKGITSDKVEYAVANTNIDWKAQAVRCAQKFREYRLYNKKELKEILLLEGFTEQEANYGAEVVVMNVTSIETNDNDRLQDISRYIDEMRALSKTVQ